MKRGFWDTLVRPFFPLAPMANVTDSAFRQIVSQCGKPDVFWTEFVSADGLCSSGRDNLLPDLYFTEKERPIVAQLFGANSENIEHSSRLCCETGFDGVDINMGCPDRAICKQKAGAALSKTPLLAKEIIKAAKRGAGEVPVSVKIRLGYDKNEIETWLPAILESRPAVVTIHARTKKEMSKVPAKWEAIKRSVEINNAWAKERFGKKWEKERSLIMGNGDVLDVRDAKKKAEETGVDGVMLGRAVFGNPWLFNSSLKKEEISLETRLETLLKHAELFCKIFGGTKSFVVLRKHFGSYIPSMPGARAIRSRLVETNDLESVRKIVQEVLRK